MPSLLADRETGLEVARRRVEFNIRSVVLVQLQAAWRLLRPPYGANSELPPAPFDWNAWQHQFSAALTRTMLNAAEDYGKVEQRYFGARGKRLEVDAQGIYARYEVRAQMRMNDFSTVTRRQVRNALLAEGGNPAQAEQVERLYYWFSPDRAGLVAVTESTSLVSAAAQWAFEMANVDRWVWNARLDSLKAACARCTALHGKIFTTRDPMPPRHPLCRCLARPLFE